MKPGAADQLSPLVTPRQSSGTPSCPTRSRCSAPCGGHAMMQTRSLEGLCHAAVTVTLLLTFSASSWGHTRPDHAPVGSPAADQAARARGRPARPAACRDTTPHHVTFVEVEPGVRLEVPAEVSCPPASRNTAMTSRPGPATTSRSSRPSASTRPPSSAIPSPVRS
jgi:hypothetical protein